MPIPTPSIKIAAKAKSTRGVKLKPEGLASEYESEYVSLGEVGLDLRFIFAQSTLRELAGSSCNCPPSPSMPVDALTWRIRG